MVRRWVVLAATTALALVVGALGAGPALACAGLRHQLGEDDGQY